MKIGDRVGLTFEHVSFRYRSTFRGPPAPSVVEDFTWALPPGRTVLLGPNGAGKTTLLSLAATSLRHKVTEAFFSPATVVTRQQPILDQLHAVGERYRELARRKALELAIV